MFEAYNFGSTPSDKTDTNTFSKPPGAMENLAGVNDHASASGRDVCCRFIVHSSISLLRLTRYKTLDSRLDAGFGFAAESSSNLVSGAIVSIVVGVGDGVGIDDGTSVGKGDGI